MVWYLSEVCRDFFKSRQEEIIQLLRISGDCGSGSVPIKNSSVELDAINK